MIKDSELRRSVKALVRAEVRFLVDPEQAERRAALLEALERLDERGEALGQTLGWLSLTTLRRP